VPDPATLAVFAGAAFLLIVVPGPDVLYVVAQALERGRSAGLRAALGTATGTLVHVAGAAVGLSALLLSSATAFEAVKLAGAAYLVYLGIRRLLARDGRSAEERPAARVYRRAVTVAALNPKTALFFVAFLPQFVQRGHGFAWLQVAILGLVFTAIGLASDSAYAVAAARAGARLRGAARGRIRRYFTGSILIGLGLAAARSER
jgi:threonine/homoserine/homoserine lactone efflux protein